MAGNFGSNDLCGNWWGGWLQAAKEKSTAALEMVRKDLAEFGCTMQKDTSHAVEVTSTTLKESMKAESRSGTKEKLSQGLNSFLEGISKAIAVPPDDEGQIPVTASTVDLQYDRAKARLHAIQVNPETYLGEPEGTPEEYRRWCEDFDLDSSKGEISELLVAEAGVRALYTKLVPARVSHVEFWQRYFYKRHQLDVDQARKEALMKRAEQSRTDSNISWDNDWSGDEDVEDSGSDWEKLPRPNQTAQPADLSERLAASATPNTPPSQQGTGIKNTAEATSQASPVLPVPLAADVSPADLRHSAESESSAAVDVSSSTFVNIHPKAADSVAGLSGREVVSDQVEAVGSSDQKESVSRKVEHSSQLEPISSPAEPVSKEVEPVSSTTEPVSKEVEPVSSTTEPMSKEVEPVSSTTKPVSSQAEPVSKKVEPVSSTMEPLSSMTEPLSSPAEPMSKKVEPVSSTTEPVSREADSMSSKTEPANSQAEAVSSLTEEEKTGRVDPNLTPVTSHTQDVPETASASGTNQIKESELSTGQTEQSIPATGEGCKADSGDDFLLMVADQKKTSSDDGDSASAVLANSVGATASALPPEEAEDWDEDLDVELTEDDMKAAEELAKTLGENVNLEEDDWENWE